MPACKAIASALLAFLLCGSAAGQTLAVRDVHVVDPDGGDILRHQAVVVRDGIIMSVGPAAAFDLPDGMEVVDGAGRWLIPGLWDMHVHLDSAAPTDFVMLVVNGVTAVRDMGGDPFRLADVRRRISAGAQVGPDIVFAGPILEDRGWLGSRRMEPGDLEHRVPVDNPSEALATVRFARQWGADLVKARNVTDARTFRAIIEAARLEGLTVAGHEPLVVPMDEAAALGMTTFEHVPFMFTLPGSEANDSDLARITRSLLDAGSYLTPTLIASNELGTPTAELLARIDEPDPRYAWLPLATREAWRESAADDAGPLPWAQMRARSLEILQDMAGAGVPILAGTDLGVPLTFPGFALHDELELLHRQGGLPPAAALKAATTEPSRLFGMTAGIRPGAVGSLVLLRRNPLLDITATREIDGVILRGRHFDRAALDGMMAAVKRDKDRFDAEAASNELLVRMRRDCDEDPTPECRVELGGYTYSKGDFSAALESLEMVRDEPGATSLLFATRINLLYGGQAQCADITPTADQWLARHAGDPERTTGILSQVLAPLAARGCLQEQERYLRRVAAVDPSGLSADGRMIHAEYQAVYLGKVQGDEEAAFSMRTSIMPEGWRSDAAALRQVADWCLAQGIALRQGRELAQQAAATAGTDIDRLYAMLTEARLAGALEDYPSAVALLEQITAVVDNDRLKALLEEYRRQAAQSP